MAVPKLRFKEFDADYTNTTFEKLKGFSIQSGKSEEKGDTGEFPFYGSTGVIGYKDIFDYEGKSILIARVGANAGSLYQIDGKYSVSDNTLRLTVSDDTSLDYLRELLIKFNLNRLVFGTGQPLVTGGMIKKVNIFIPEFTEQTKIASFLSNVDEKISQLTQKHALLSQYKQGMMQKLFSQQIRFKADDGSEFGEWEDKKLGDICSHFQSGKTITSATISDNGAYPVFGGNGLRGFTDTYTHDGIFALIGRQGALCGNINLVQGENFISEHAIAVQANQESSTQWLAMWLDFMQLNRFSESSAQAGLAVNKLVKFDIKVPCLEEQTKIAKFLSAIDQKIEVVVQQIEQAKQWKKGLLQQMFV
ncbi:restriction endonuclease subunit S [Acinetobacter towneri]|nr:restriction endonuclease subunit S [Acinetobacter towneri]UNT63678.1 restriction endonuclease subunit S [Acinetobacter towneri]